MGGAAGRADRQLRPAPAAPRRAAAPTTRRRAARPAAGRGGRRSGRGRRAGSPRGSRGTRRARRPPRRSVAKRGVGLGDRLDARLRPVLVRVVVVVGQREEEEVVEVLLHQLGGAAGGVAVAVAGDRGRAAGHLAAGVEVAVEEIGRAPGVVVELEFASRRPRGAAGRRARPRAAGGRGRSGTACRRCGRRRLRGSRTGSRPPG